MNTKTDTYTLPIDFEMAFTLAETKEWNSFEMRGNKLIFNGVVDQQVSYIRRSDEVLLEKSLSVLNFFSKECMQISICCHGGEKVTSNIIKGTKSSVSTSKEIKNTINELVFKCRQRGLEVAHIDISHTHLGRQFIEIKEGKVSRLETHGLSKRDIECVHEIKPFIDYPIKLRAITQEKMVYEKMIA